MIQQVVFALIIENLQFNTGGVSCTVQGVEVTIFHGGVTHFTVVGIHIFGFHHFADSIHIFVHRILNKFDIVAQFVHIVNHIRQITIRFVIIFHIQSQQVIADGIRHSLIAQVFDGLFEYSTIVVVIEIFVQQGKCLLIQIHIRRMHGDFVDIIIVVQVFGSGFTQHHSTVDKEEPVGTGYIVKGTQSIQRRAVSTHPFIQRGFDYVTVGAAIENASINVKATIQLRHLRVLTVRSSGVTGFHTTAEVLGLSVTFQQVTNQRFGSNGVGFRQGVPVNHQNFLFLYQFFDTFPIFRTYFQVVFDYDGTAVYTEAFVIGFGFQHIDNVVHQIAQAEFGLFRSVTPFTVPVRTTDNVHGILFAHSFSSKSTIEYS